MPTVIIGDNTGDDFSGTDDCFLGLDFPAQNNNGTALAVHKFGAADHAHSLVRFTGLTNITGPVTVSSATLKIYQTTDGGGPYTVDARRCIRDWVEAQATWNIFKTANNWGTAGGLNDTSDRVSTIVGSVSVGTGIAYHTLTGAGLATDSENWINGVNVNEGWHLERNGAGNDSTYKLFGSSDGTDGQRPQLTVTYSAGAVTAVLSGTATASIVEADGVAGGKTIILTVANDTLVPAAALQTLGYIANALGGTADTTSFSITLPTTVAGDLLILEFVHRGTTDGTIGGTSITTGGLTWTQKHSQLFGASAFSGKLLWTRATGDHAGQTVTGASLTNACAAILTQYRNAVASGDPFTNAATIVGEQNISTNETQAQITTLVDGCMVCLTVLNSPDLAIATQANTSPGTLVERAERLSTGGTDASITHASELKATAGATGAFTWTQGDAASGSYAYAIEPLVSTPFADARAAIRDGGDSAQSEGGGWDSKIKPNIPLGNIVRTSDTVITVTLQAQADYNITAQETITWTIPATALTGAAPVVAAPTFTIDPVGGGTSILRQMINYHGG